MKNAVRSPSDLLKTLSDEILPLVSKPNRYVGNEIGLCDLHTVTLAQLFSNLSQSQSRLPDSLVQGEG